MKKFSSILLTLILSIVLCFTVIACGGGEEPQPEPTPATYTLTFNMGGHGEQVASQTLGADEKPTEPATPTAEGYTFDAWYADSSYSVYFNFNNSLEADATAYAKWIENVVEPEVTYTLTFDMGGHGAQVAAQTLGETDLPTQPTAPVADGWNFEGWYTDTTYTTAFNFTAPLSANATAYAKWTEAVQT